MVTQEQLWRQALTLTHVPSWLADLDGSGRSRGAHSFECADALAFDADGAGMSERGVILQEEATALVPGDGTVQWRTGGRGP